MSASDSGKAQVVYVGDGTVVGAVAQYPCGMGERMVRTAVDAINGKTVESFVDSGFYWCDKTTFEVSEISKVLYD